MQISFSGREDFLAGQESGCSWPCTKGRTEDIARSISTEQDLAVGPEGGQPGGHSRVLTAGFL